MGLEPRVLEHPVNLIFTEDFRSQMIMLNSSCSKMKWTIFEFENLSIRSYKNIGTCVF